MPNIRSLGSPLKYLPLASSGRTQTAVNPGALLAMGYVIMILIGSGLLSMPWASHGCSYIDALFTSSSATCVTGLIVKDTGTDFTLLGQIIILLLIQIGGLGYMTLSSAFFFLIGQRTSLRHRLLMKESINFLSFGNLRRFAFTIIKVTLVVEATGALVMTLWLRFYHGFAWTQAIYHGTFQSVSAFCNAGFSTFSGNLERFAQDPVIGPVIALLVIAGGIGFIVISDVWKRIQGETLRLATHSKLVISATIVLILVGTGAILLGEWNGALKDLPIGYKITNAFFTAVTPRTAGFNLVAPSGMHSYTLIILMVFMFVGASPGGTGGGVKTTTFSLLFGEILRVLRGRDSLVLLRRTIKPEQVHRAITIITLSAVLVLTSTFLLVLFRDGTDVMRSAFEAISAFGTVGLSLGARSSTVLSFAADFHVWGKLVLIFTMLFGRVGTFTVGSAIFSGGRPSRVRPAQANIVVG